MGNASPEANRASRKTLWSQRSVTRENAALSAKPRLSTLLKKSRELHRQQIETEHQLAELDRQMLAAEAPPKTRKRGTKEPRDIGEAIRAVVRVLCASSEPLAPREIASRLSIEPSLASQRLHRAVKLGLVERTGNGRYRATADTKSAVTIVDR